MKSFINTSTARLYNVGTLRAPDSSRGFIQRIAEITRPFQNKSELCINAIKLNFEYILKSVSKYEQMQNFHIEEGKSFGVIMHM